MKDMNSQIEKIVKNHMDDIDYFKNQVETFEKDPELAPVLKLLTCESSIVYRIFGASQNNLASMSSLLCTIHHALVDDGELCVLKRVNTVATNMNKHINEFYKEKGWDIDLREEVVYEYYVGSDCSGDHKLIFAKEIEEIIDVYQKSYDFYNEHAEAINHGGLGCEKDSEWFKLKVAADEFLKDMYERNLW